MAYILSLDLGTTSCRSLIVSPEGVVIASSQKEFKQYFPKPGFVEHDPFEVLDCQLEVAKRAISDSGIAASEIRAIGVTNQRETTLIWEKGSGRPIGRAIVWQDRRTAPLCTKMREFEPLIQKKTGLLLDPYFSATKIVALLEEHAESIKGKEILFGTFDSWLIYHLTGKQRHVTDVTNASRTLLFNIHTKEWDEELLSLFQIPRELLPEVQESSSHFGDTTLFGGKIPICGCAGDQQAALFGHLAFDAGSAKCTYGTGAFLLMNTGDQAILSQNRLLTTVACSYKGQARYALEGSLFMAGGAVQWLRDHLKMIQSYDEVETLASAVETSAGVLFVPAFTGLAAPYWDPEARGALFGLTRGSEPGHIARALLEGIAFSISDLIEAMASDSHMPLRALHVDGGASRNDLLMQIQSDLLQIPVERSCHQEITAMGAAFLAGLYAGVWKSEEELKGIGKLGARFTPQKKICKESWKRGIASVRQFHGS